ncbi:hypothetical protein [Kribbella sp. NPDC051770]|uniref:hypothetical protein n=1 Tax=Kribbella sp. NPDC051770 TaxID=3155413 RepID=UPI003431EE6D
MAQYEVIARTRQPRRLTTSAYLDSAKLDKGMRFVRTETLPDGRVAVVLQHKSSPRKHDFAAATAHRTLAQLGIPAIEVEQLDLFRLDKHGRALVRSWKQPPADPSGDREPRRPLPNPPSLRAFRD